MTVHELSLTRTRDDLGMALNRYNQSIRHQDCHLFDRFPRTRIGVPDFKSHMDCNHTATIPLCLATPYDRDRAQGRLNRRLRRARLPGYRAISVGTMDWTVNFLGEYSSGRPSTDYPLSENAVQQCIAVFQKPWLPTHISAVAATDRLCIQISMVRSQARLQCINHGSLSSHWVIHFWYFPQSMS
jgi:hypothetical protein